MTLNRLPPAPNGKVDRKRPPSHVGSALDPHLSILTAFSTPGLEAVAGGTGRGMRADAADMSEDETEQMIAPNPVAGA